LFVAVMREREGGEREKERGFGKGSVGEFGRLAEDGCVEVRGGQL
jgi:hypothetical protein